MKESHRVQPAASYHPRRTRARGRGWHDGRRGALAAEPAPLIAARVNGELRDLACPVADGDVVEPVDIASDDGRYILRHSTAHVMAQAVQDLFPQAKLGIGPPVENGFYYDFDVPAPFTPEDLKAIEGRMRQIVKQGQRFSRRVVTDEQARAELADEPYKLELIGLKGHAIRLAGLRVGRVASRSVGRPSSTIYDNLDPGHRRAALEGPVPRPAPAHHQGHPGVQADAHRRRLLAGQREEPAAAADLRHRLGVPGRPGRATWTCSSEAEKRDHRKLGAELDLFSFPTEIGSGLPVFHPKGGIIRRVMEDYSRRRHEEAGYEFVNTPHITKADLFEHLRAPGVVRGGHVPAHGAGRAPSTTSSP